MLFDIYLMDLCDFADIEADSPDEALRQVLEEDYDSMKHLYTVVKAEPRHNLSTFQES